MSRAPAKTTQADYRRALRAFEQVHGVKGTLRFEKDGTVTIIPADHSKPKPDELSSLEPEKEIIL